MACHSTIDEASASSIVIAPAGTPPPKKHAVVAAAVVAPGLPHSLLLGCSCSSCSLLFTPVLGGAALQGPQKMKMGWPKRGSKA
jgi:hypothetical protein